MKQLFRYALIFPAFVLCSLAEAQTRMAPEDIPEAGRFEFDGRSLVLPLAESGSHPMISVDLGDGEEYRFIVDTGASVHVMDNALAEKLGYKVTGEMSIGAPGGRQVPGNIVEVPTFSAGTATINGAEFVTMDISRLTGGLSQGVIGLALFREHLLTYDLGQQEIVVSREELSRDDPGVMAYASFHGKIQFDMDVAGVKVPSHLDTGSMGEFMLPAEIIESLPLQGPVQKGPEARMVGGPRKTSFATLEGNISFAGLEFPNPKVTFMNPSTGFGNIGGGIYGRYVMSIDQRNNLIAFREPTSR